MSKNFVVILILVIIVVGGYFLMKNKKVEAPDILTPTTSDNSIYESPMVDQNTNRTQKATILYTDAGYSPATLTVKVGDTVTWKNNSSGNMWTASGMHPSHTVYGGTDVSAHCPDTLGTAFDECKGEAPGSSWSFTFQKKGAWGYHNHLKASHFGKVVVE